MALTARNVTFPARLSYNDLFTPRAAEQGGKPKYEAVLLIPKNDEKTIAAVNAAINAAVQDAVSRGTIKQAIDPAMTQYPPLRDGDRPKNNGESRGDAYQGHWFITAKAPESRKPFVVDGNVRPILDQSEVYSGMYVNAAVEFYVYSNSGNVGVAASLDGIQKDKDGERLGAAPVTAEDVFSTLGGAAAASPNLGF